MVFENKNIIIPTHEKEKQKSEREREQLFTNLIKWQGHRILYQVEAVLQPSPTTYTLQSSEAIIIIKTKTKTKKQGQKQPRKLNRKTEVLSAHELEIFQGVGKKKTKS